VTTNVVSIETRRAQTRRRPSLTAIKDELTDFLTQPISQDESQDAHHSEILRELDELSSDMLVRKLQIIHRKEAAIRGWTLEEQQIAAEIEAACYLAYRHGVPEEAIYDLNDEALSEGLQSAMNKLAGA
jgi:hypothetical protein